MHYWCMWTHRYRHTLDYSRSQTCIMTDLMAAILASITTRLTYGLANTFYWFWCSSFWLGSLSSSIHTINRSRSGLQRAWHCIVPDSFVAHTSTWLFSRQCMIITTHGSTCSYVWDRNAMQTSALTSQCNHTALQHRMNQCCIANCPVHSCCTKQALWQPSMCESY